MSPPTMTFIELALALFIFKNQHFITRQSFIAPAHFGLFLPTWLENG